MAIRYPEHPDFEHSMSKTQDGRWRVRVYLGRDAKGRVKQWTHTSRSTSKAMALDEFRDAYAARLGNPAIAGLLDDYVRWCEAQGRAKATVRAYRTRARWAKPYVGQIRVRDLTQGDVMDMNDNLLEDGAMRKGGISVNSVRYCDKLLQTFYKWAAARGYVARSPLVGFALPPMRRVEAHAIDDVTLDALRAHLSEAMGAAPSDAAGELARCEAMGAYLALALGVRVAEACAIRRRDVNLRLAQVSVVGQVREDGFLHWEEGTKGHRSRVVPLADEAAAAIRAHMAWQDSIQRRGPSATLLATSRAALMRPVALSRAFRALMARLGDAEGEYRFHSLRHTFATQMVYDGVPITELAAILGHASTSTTVDMYGHVRAGVSEAARRSMGALARAPDVA